jgi:hypothetical protein
LVQACLLAMLARLSGLRAIVERCRHWLPTRNFSSLSPALRRPTAVRFVQALLERLQPWAAPGAGELVAIDSMALTLSKTRRHGCQKFNNKTVGGGVLWAYQLQARRGLSPVRLLKTMVGAWSDAVQMRGVELAARGPIYLMDRGFYAFDLLEAWLGAGVHFIVRARDYGLQWDLVDRLSPARWLGNQYLLLDAVVELGGPTARRHPRVRLVRLRLATGEWLSLVTDLRGWSAQRLAAAYRQRYHIERFHKFLKEALGLAHLYSFGQRGLEFLLRVALLLALLIHLSYATGGGAVIDQLRAGLRALRRLLGLGTLWRRNACTRHWRKKKTAAQRGENL